MVLDSKNQDRNYLFGRLLAVYERIEVCANGNDRETNAIKLQSAFVQHPGMVWRTMEQQVNPYMGKLSPATREYMRKLITEIVSNFKNQEDMDMNMSLNENYLLGYYLQRAEFYTRNNEKGEE